MGWTPDELPGFEKLEIPLPSEGDGELAATLVRAPGVGRSAASWGKLERAVLYVHGYVDYFFQAHLAEEFERAGFAFFALDLRRAGRSLRPGNVPFQIRHVDDYFPEIDRSLEELERLGFPHAALLAHSTGCLVASLYARRGERAASLDCLLLNSPFFEFRATPLERQALRIVAWIGRRAPRLPAPVSLNPAYGGTLHESVEGSWTYDLEKKPHRGFGITSGWIAAIADGHRELQSGLGLSLPILVLHSAQSHAPGRGVTPRDHGADIVLDVEHMKRFAPSLGANVELAEFADGLHDLVLSRPDVRERVVARMIEFARLHTSSSEPSQQEPSET